MSTDAAQTSQAQQPQIEIDDSKVAALYANFYRVMGTPEEVIIDLGVNPQPAGIPPNPIAISQKVILNYYTAKRMLQALAMTVQHYEQMFGVLETDINRRVRPGIVPQPPQG